MIEIKKIQRIIKGIKGVNVSFIIEKKGIYFLIKRKNRLNKLNINRSDLLNDEEEIRNIIKKIIMEELNDN